MLHFRMDLGQLFHDIKFVSHDQSPSESGFHSDSASDVSSSQSSILLDEFTEGITCKWAPNNTSRSIKMQQR